MVVEIDSVEGGRSLEEIAGEIADAIAFGSTDTSYTATLLLEFAEEIKRQSIEP